VSTKLTRHDVSTPHGASVVLSADPRCVRQHEPFGSCARAPARTDRYRRIAGFSGELP
jgi:hypothetical protein